MEEKIRQSRIIDLLNIDADIEWQTSSLWLRIYSFHGIPSGAVYRLNELYPNKINIGNKPVWVHFLTLAAPFEISNFEINKLNTEIGQLAITFNGSSQKILPASSYCVVATTLNVNGAHGSEAEAKRTLNCAVGLLRLHFGYAAFHELVKDDEIKLSDGSFNIRTGAVRILQKNEGPFLHPQNWKDSDAVAQAIHQGPNKGRLSLALEYVHKGISESDFMSYWLSLELICDTHKENGIVEKIADAYELTFNQVKKDDLVGFKHLLRARQDFFHKGIRPTFNTDVERYIQLFLLDLLRNEVGLPKRKNAIAYLQHANPSLHFLGLTPPPNPEPELKPHPRREEPDATRDREIILNAYKEMLDKFHEHTIAIWPHLSPAPTITSVEDE